MVNVMTNPAAHTPERGPSSEALNDSLDEVWIRAEEDYGLVRPEPGETVIAVHRQTSQRLAHAHETWDEIPVHFDMPPEAILSDIAFGYNDIVPIGMMPHGGYVECMTPRDPLGCRCWHLLTMCLCREMTF